jgi:hypothetical protein
MRVEEHCIDIERIEEVLALPADHPERRHVDTCPRCTSLAASYRSFVEAQPDEDAGLDQARVVLDTRIRDDARRWSPPQAARSPLSRASMWDVFRRPAFVVAFVSAVIAAVAVFTLRSPERETFRGSRTQATGFVLHPADIAADGTIHLSWEPVTGANEYQVRIYGPDMSEIYHSSPAAETSLTLSRSVLPGDLPASLNLTWQVDALTQGDVVGSSAPGSIQTP